MTTKKLLRCKSALVRLQEQLESGVKPVKTNPALSELLTDSDKKRIVKEIATLKTKIK